MIIPPAMTSRQRMTASAGRKDRASLQKRNETDHSVIKEGMTPMMPTRHNMMQVGADAD